MFFMELLRCHDAKKYYLVVIRVIELITNQRARIRNRFFFCHDTLWAPYFVLTLNAQHSFIKYNYKDIWAKQD